MGEQFENLETKSLGNQNGLSFFPAFTFCICHLFSNVSTIIYTQSRVKKALLFLKTGELWHFYLFASTLTAGKLLVGFPFNDAPTAKLSFLKFKPSLTMMLTDPSFH
jgi:hypothetical protein